jgi:hypothetical protein
MEQVIHPKFIVNAQGQPTDVILSWEEYLDISEILGLDLDDQTKTYLREARRDRETGNAEAYISLDLL